MLASRRLMYPSLVNPLFSLPEERVPLVLEAHRDAVVGEGPQALAQGVVQLGGPLVAQESNDLLAAGESSPRLRQRPSGL